MTHGGDGEAEEQAGVGDKWTPWGERSLASLDRLAEVFSKVYTINKGRDVLDGVACGRYPVSVCCSSRTQIARATGS